MRKCKCYTCTHSDQPELLVAYYTGYTEACVEFLLWAKHNKIKMGSIADDDLGGLYARIQYNHDESHFLKQEAQDIINNQKDAQNDVRNKIKRKK